MNLTINNKAKFSALKHILTNNKFFVVFSNDTSRSVSDNSDITNTSLSSVFTTSAIDFVFVKEFVPTDILVACLQSEGLPHSDLVTPETTTETADLLDKYYFIKASDAISTEIKNMTYLYFNTSIEANAGEPRYNTVTLLYCPDDKSLPGRFVTDYTYNGSYPPQPETNPFISMEATILAQVRPASNLITVTAEPGEVVPRLEALIKF